MIFHFHRRLPDQTHKRKADQFQREELRREVTQGLAATRSRQPHVDTVTEELHDMKERNGFSEIVRSTFGG